MVGFGAKLTRLDALLIASGILVLGEYVVELQAFESMGGGDVGLGRGD